MLLGGWVEMTGPPPGAARGLSLPRTRPTTEYFSLFFEYF